MVYEHNARDRRLGVTSGEAPPAPNATEATAARTGLGATLTTADVAGLLGVNMTMVREQVTAGRLRASRQGSAFRFRPQDVDAYMEAGRIEPGSMPWV